MLTPAVAGLATVAAATSLTGVIQGWSWLAYLIVATVLVGCTGLALRSLRVPPLVVGMAQLLVLLFLVIGVFTRSGILAVIPGPAALSELNDVLVAAFDEIRTGLPPVEPSTPILCLVTIAIGLVAILVDTLAVAAAAPAATGLILLCVYAVPSALAGELLPWWTFAVGAAAFAGLLAVDGSHRHRRWRNRSSPGLGASPGSASAPVTVVALSLVVGLVAGSTVTAIGTEGSLPGSTPGGSRVPGGLGVNPFTSLRGMLDQGSNVELFRVRGLGDDRRLLRAFTLDTYRPNEGWGLPEGPMPAGVPANGPLPAAPGDDGYGESREIRIEPVNWYDLWLPVYGAPRGLRNVSEGWFYDRTSGTVFRERRQRPAPYFEIASLREPTKAELRIADPQTEQLPPVYTTVDDVDPRVHQLAQRLTANATNNFDRAEAIWQYFSPANGFEYDTETAPANDPDALADFLLNGKRGFCEQYASAMAVMLRSIGIPSRVAVGFTTGYPTGAYRSITSQDAHAWVEVYFGDQGWVSFDPTPLSDGRGYIPPYLQPDDVSGDPSSGADDEVPTASSSESSSAAALPEEPTQGNTAQPQRPIYAAPSWAGWSALVTALLGVALLAAAAVLGRRVITGRHRSTVPPVPRWVRPLGGGLLALALLLLAWQLHWTVALALLVTAAVGLGPAAVRELVRRRRLRVIAAREPAAANAAWDELLDECADRGITIPRSDTVRLAAQKVAQRHHLDERGKNDLRTVVTVVERSWYSPAGGPDAEFARAFTGLRGALRRSAPLSWRGRLLPRSLFRRRTPAT
ncbi:transglutaminase [Prauserella muralis]|uniref:Transglutaminase n=1 Tax=Prauserella muralis TaxID=588067 RepID=A0A2V4B1J4_9PSEU|nr:transglutaminase [Prauserella muralis]